MGKKIDLELKYSVDDYVRALTYIQNRNFFVRYGFVFLPLILLVLFFLILYLQDGQITAYQVAITLAPILFIFLLLLLVKFIPNPFLKWNVRRQFASSPLLNEKQQMTFDELGIKGQTNLSSGETKWNAVTEVAETPEDLFFFTSRKFAMFVPKNILTAEQVKGIKELATKHLGEKTKF